MATLEELKAKLQAIIDEYKLVSKEKALVFTAATKTVAKIEPKIPDTNRHAVVAYYASHFCNLVWKFCEQNNEFARKKITAEQRNANQQALQRQIRTLLNDAGPAFRNVMATEANAHIQRQLNWPDNKKTEQLTEVSYREVKYPNTDALIAAMQAEFDALVVGNICSCSFCSAFQLPAPVSLKAGDVIAFAAAFEGSEKKGQDFYNQSIAEIIALPVIIRAEDLDGYNAEIAKIAAFLRDNPSSTIDVSIGTSGASPEGDNIAKLQALLRQRADKVRRDFESAGISRGRINIIILPLGQPNLAIQVTIK